MSLRVVVRFRRKLIVAFFILVVILVWLTPAAFADGANVNLTIKVSDEKGRPVPNAQISIPRQGSNRQGQELREIHGETDDNGEFKKHDTDFQLTGTDHKIIVKAGELSSETLLSDQQLREAMSNSQGVLTIEITLKLAKKKQRLAISGTVIDEAGKPVIDAEISLSAQGTRSTPPAIEPTAKSGPDGRFQLPNVEFEQGDPSRVLKISATGFEEAQVSLANEDLVKSSNNSLQLNPIRLKTQPPRFEQTKIALNWIFWIVGLITTLVLIAKLIYRINRWRINRKNPPLHIESRLSPEAYAGKILNEVRDIRSSMLTEAKLDPVLTRSLNAWLDEHDKQGSNNQQQGGKSTTTEREPVTSPESLQSRTQQSELIRDPQRMAQEAYQNLLNKNPIDHEPVYLDVEGPRSAAGRLEDKTVYLTQVNHSNAALVLFTENDRAGWLFPNPKLAFSRAAIEDVFLDLTEEEYQARKFELKPVSALRVDDGRWKIASS